MPEMAVAWATCVFPSLALIFTDEIDGFDYFCRPLSALAKFMSKTVGVSTVLRHFINLGLFWLELNLKSLSFKVDIAFQAIFFSLLARAKISKNFSIPFMNSVSF